MEYPTIWVKRKVDRQGRVYLTTYSKEKTEAVISLGDRNTTITGIPKLNLRFGDSQFGEQLFFEFLGKGEIRTLPKRSNYDTIEIYYATEKGIQFLKDSLDYFKRNKVVGIQQKLQCRVQD